MTAKPVEIYQGSDWLTYRWSVAQAFDTLDRVRDLCLQIPGAAGAGPGKSAAPRYEMPDEEIADLFGYIAELCDDLTGEIDAVLADLFFQMQSSLANRWLAFEMRLYLGDLRTRAVREAESDAHEGQPLEAIMTLAGRIKSLLKQIDQ